MEKLLNKENKRKILIFILPPILSFVMWLLFLSLKKRFHIPKDVPNEPIIFAFWHGKLLLEPLTYKKLRKNVKIKLMISDHFDGELLAKTMSFFGFGTIRGSSSKGGIKALRESFKRIGEGYDIGITPDGPRGPGESVADGIVAMSQKKRLKIVALNYRASSFWQLKSWDQFIIPKPFSQVDLYASEPFSVDNVPMQEAKDIIRKKINESV